MKKCKQCDEKVSMPYKCHRCNKNFCSKHRLPEKHNCPYLNRGGKNSQQIIDELSKDKSKSSKAKHKAKNMLNNTSGRMWLYFLSIIIITYVLQFITLIFFGENVHNSIFVFQADKLEYVWTIFTSIFAHSPNGLFHIIGNIIILVFFGRLLEQIIGTKKFTLLFLISGAIAGLSQIIFSVMIGNPTAGVLGASGSLSAVLGALTIYNPKMKVYLYFIIPIQLWIITVLYVVFSIVAIASLGSIMGNVAHIAHLVGLIIGISYGYITRDKYKAPSVLRR